MQLIAKDSDKGYLDSMLWVPKKHINIEGTKKALTFTFLDQQKVSVLCLWKETDDHLLLPREFWDISDLSFPVVDIRPKKFQQVTIPSNIVLDALTPEKTIQRDAFSALEKARGGILQLACGVGKTVIALAFAAKKAVPTLIIVDNTQLLNQWKIAILGDGHLRKPHLGLTEDEVGLIRGDVFDWKKPIVLATYHTLANIARALPEEVRRWFGLVIWDEGHHIAAPTFARTADLFYGYRLSLTATPTRDDGLHVIYDLHIGKVIFKDLRQELHPRIYFMWTGLELDLAKQATKTSACDRNGELHLSKLAGHFGQWAERLNFILTEVRKATATGRKVLVLSNSISQLVNLLALWIGYPDLYSDIPIPTSKEVGESAPPQALEPAKRVQITRQLQLIRIQLRDAALNPLKRQNLQIRETELAHLLKMDDVASKLHLELTRRQHQFIKQLVSSLGNANAGLMIHRVKTADRSLMLATKQVVFAVSKYGREGLDESSLDTVFICEPFSSRNILQQVLGRILRKKTGKKTPVAIFLEDNIGPIIGMCQKLRRALREWPIEDGGPYTYEMIGHPKKGAFASRNWMQ